MSPFVGRPLLWEYRQASRFRYRIQIATLVDAPTTAVPIGSGATRLATFSPITARYSRPPSRQLWSVIADDFQYVSPHSLLQSRRIPVLVPTTFVLAEGNPMKRRIVFALVFAAMVNPVLAQPSSGLPEDSPLTTPSVPLTYVGGNGRVSIGIDQDGNNQGEAMRVFAADDGESALVAQLWWQNGGAGGLQLDYN